MDELYLENIDEYVTDQNKIVTYKWLSLTLGVHVNQAKQMLFDYVERKRKENAGAQLHVTYLVTGKHVQKGCAFHKVAVVKEEKLEAVKSRLAVVSSVHIYSIQKAVLKDSGPLFSTDYDIIKANLDICSKFSAIQCSFAVRRAPAQRSSQEPSEQQTTSVPLTNGHGPTLSKNATSQSSKGIMGMFAGKATSKSQNASKDTKPEVKEPPVSTASNKSTAKSNAMNNFFGKASMKKKSSLEFEQNVKEEKAVTEPERPEPEVSMAMSSGDKPVGRPEAEPTEKPESKPSSVAEPAVRQKKTQKSKVKREEMPDSDDEKNSKKKRRRIKKPVSESSGDEEDSVSPPAMEEQPPSPLPPSEPALKREPESQPIMAQPSEKKRKRRRVLKSKTFMDEEGSIVTEKHYESESCTDSESEAAKPKPPVASKQSISAATKNNAKLSKKGAAAPANKGVKQSSIMGFFQKK